MFDSTDYQYITAFHPFTLLGRVFGPGIEFGWNHRYSRMNPALCCTIHHLKPWAWGEPVVYTNSIEILKHTADGGTVSPWRRPQWTLDINLFWGQNILVTHYAEWRRHRKVMQPAFNPKMYEMVWSETLRLYNQMLVAEKFPTKIGDTVSFAHFEDLTQRVALCIILSCGFGFPFNWDEKDTSVSSKSFKLDDGIRAVGENLITISFAPSWLYKFPLEKKCPNAKFLVTRLRRIRESRDGLTAWFQKAITQKKAEIEENIRDNNGDIDQSQLRNDVFTRINLENYLERKTPFSDSEIMGNTWVIYAAGHETTSSSLASAFCLLAVYPEEQQVIYEEVAELMAKCGTEELSFEHYDSLPKTRGAFAEALRMYPAAIVNIKECTQDIIVKVPVVENDGSVREENVHFAKGTQIIYDFVGIHYNPRTFPEPHLYKPSRWYNATSDDAYTFFSQGPRTCLGRKFSLTEGVCWIAHIMKNFTVAPLLANGEDLQGWKKRVLDTGSFGFSFSVNEAPLVFKRR
ncbi:cytochrome P450 [Serendipita vermifera]|nr:cytochrome P450 [Serendipita vermifera]